MAKQKIISVKRARAVRDALTRRGKKLVFTNGCFDIIHLGHVRYLQAARRLGDALMVGLNTDASVRRLKGPERPLNPERNRAEVLAALEMVDYVVLFGDDTPLALISTVVPQVLAKGSDYKHNEIVGADVVRKHGGAVRRVRLEKGISTTNIIQKMKGA